MKPWYLYASFSLFPRCIMFPWIDKRLILTHRLKYTSDKAGLACSAKWGFHAVSVSCSIVCLQWGLVGQIFRRTIFQIKPSDAHAPKTNAVFRPTFRLAPSSAVWKEEVSRGSDGWLEGMCVCVCISVCDCISMYEVCKWKGAYC